MTIDKKIIEAIENFNVDSKRKQKLQAKIDKYNKLIERGYIKKQTYSLSRLDSIGYTRYSKQM